MTYEGQTPPTSIEKAEHIHVNGVEAKRTLISGYDGTDIQDLNVTTDGTLIATTPIGIPKYDEIVLAYTDGNVTTATYKLSTATVATITLTYTSSELTGVTIA